MSSTNVPDTKQRILDVAERLFANHGYHYPSMRMITSEAGVNLAAVNYHFGSKEALLDEVFRRRSVPLNKIRREQLEQVRDRALAEKRPPDVGDVLRAFVVPTIRYCYLESGAEHYSTLVGRAIAEPDGTVRNVFMHYIMPLFNQLFELMQAALPDLDRDTVFWRLHFAIGSTSHTLRIIGKPEILPEGIDREFDVDVLVEQLMAFITVGAKQS